MKRRRSSPATLLARCVPGGLAAGVGAVAFSTTTPAQSVLHHIQGDEGERLGWSVHGAGDLNGDGHHDFLVGVPHDNIVFDEAGSIRAYSGLDGSYLHFVYGDAALQELGTAVAGGGDVDADGVPDFIGGTDLRGAFVFSGADGSVLHFLQHDADDMAGRAVAILDDIDGDGHDDVAVGGIGDFYTSHDPNIKVYSGADGSLLHALFHPSLGSGFGSVIAPVGDLTGDGVRDFLAGVATHSVVQVYSGRTGNKLQVLAGTDNFGRSISDAGDVDGDGNPDYLVASSVAVSLHARDGSVMHTFPGQDVRSVVGGGDIDGDGTPDILIGGGDGGELGWVEVYSGDSRQRLVRLEGDEVGVMYASALAFAGDVDADGADDLVVGAPLSTTEWDLGGVATVHAGNDLFLAADRTELQAGDSLTRTVREGRAQGVGLLVVVDVNGAPFWFVEGGLFRFDDLGSEERTLTVPGGLAGLSVTYLAFGQDDAGGTGVSAPLVLEFL